jgi:hypothetical protein
MMKTNEHTRKSRKDAPDPSQDHCAIPTLRGFSVWLETI